MVGEALEERRAWDRQPGEPDKWYSRFNQLRLMPPAIRSIEKVWQAEQNLPGAKQSKKGRPSQPWYDAAGKWRWKLRAEAWDEYQREQARLAEEEAYRTAIQAHQKHAAEIANRTLVLSTALLEKASAKLSKINIEQIPIKDLPHWLRVAAVVSEAALNCEAQALTVDQLIKQMASESETS